LSVLSQFLWVKAVLPGEQQACLLKGFRDCVVYAIAFEGVVDRGFAARKEVQGRIEVAESALARLEELAEEEWVREDTAERVRGIYNYRRHRFVARLDGDEDGLEERSVAYQRLLRELLRAQRQALKRLRDEGKIGDKAMDRIEHDLDLEESRLEATPT
jgi:hypothetical protein